MCNELKVGQLRKSGGGLVHEVLAIGEKTCFSRYDGGGVSVEQALPIARILTWEVVTKYHDFKIDEPVLARIGSIEVMMHFAGVTSGGTPKVWADGRTSHTAAGPQHYWTASDVRKLKGAAQ